MSTRQHILNLLLRLIVKTNLARMKRPQDLRRQLERDAVRHFHVPDSASFIRDVIRPKGGQQNGSAVDALWASCRNPDRRKVILYFHGGAFIAGSSQTHRHLGAALADATGVRAFLPDYRLAPEDPFPAAVDDALVAYLHLLDAGYEPAEIALGGDSAGGGLAFALLLKLAQVELPQPAAIVAFSPWADMTGQSESLRRNAQRDVMLPVRRMHEVVDFYLASHDRADPLASPALAEWKAPPPALILASRSEILVDDARKLAQALREGGGSVQLELWRGLPHAWPIFAGRLPEADQAITSAGAFLARHLCAEKQALVA